MKIASCVAGVICFALLHASAAERCVPDSRNESGRTCAWIEESSRVPTLVDVTSELAPKTARYPGVRSGDPSPKQADPEIDEATWRLRSSD